MKKILIVNDNMHMGGIQKSLVNFLKANHENFEITLLLLFKSGELISEIPRDVNVISSSKFVSVLGAYKSDLKNNFLGYFWKGFLVTITKLFSKKIAFKLAGLFQKTIKGFDVAISFSHPSKCHDLKSCSAEFVLSKTSAKEKICFLHGDYKNDSNQSEYTDLIYRSFDKIACCSDSVKKHFLDVLPELKDKAYTVRNFFDLSLCQLDKSDNYIYDENYINIVTVARLSPEKGIERAIQAIRESKRQDIRYYIVGSGPSQSKIEEMIANYSMSDSVFLLGETDRPEKYIKNADYLLVPSFHEAAPMVFDEAKLLGVNIITTDTTSAVEMVGNDGGIVCENSMEGLKETFISLTKCTLSKNDVFNNDMQYKQLSEMIHL